MNYRDRERQRNIAAAFFDIASVYCDFPIRIGVADAPGSVKAFASWDHEAATWYIGLGYADDDDARFCKRAFHEVAHIALGAYKGAAGGFDTQDMADVLTGEAGAVGQFKSRRIDIETERACDAWADDRYEFWKYDLECAAKGTFWGVKWWTRQLQAGPARCDPTYRHDVISELGSAVDQQVRQVKSVFGVDLAPMRRAVKATMADLDERDQKLLLRVMGKNHGGELQQWLIQALARRKKYIEWLKDLARTGELPDSAMIAIGAGQ